MPKPLPPSAIRSPEWWAVVVSVIALIVAVASLVHTDRRDEERDARAAALRMCETYTSGEAMRSLTDKIFEGSIPNESITSDSERNYDLAKQGSVKGIRFKRQLVTWLNFLDVVGTGLTTKAYDFKIIKECFASSFDRARQSLIGPVFSIDDYPNIRTWAVNLNNPSYQP